MAPDMGKINDYQTFLTFTTTGNGNTYTKIDIDDILPFPSLFVGEKDINIQKYIINENATILFWDDDTKTISKRDKDDKFDKELGFLFAYFYKKYKGSKASMKRVIDCIDYKKIKTFLFEFYVIDSEQTAEQARKYLKNLKFENK